MTRKDFERIAQVFRVNKPPHIDTDSNLWASRQWISMLNDMCVEMKAINPKFNEDTFRKACAKQIKEDNNAS